MPTNARARKPRREAARPAAKRPQATEPKAPTKAKSPTKSPTKAKSQATPQRGARGRVSVVRRGASSAPARPRAGALTAEAIMRREVITVDLDTPLAEVERIFGEQRIGGAPVTDGRGNIVGVVSLRDLMEHYGADGVPRPRRAPAFYALESDETLEEDLEAYETPPEAEETVADVMTGEVYSVPVDASLRDIARAMVERRIHRVLVEKGGTYVGLVGTPEILAALAKETSA